MDNPKHSNKLAAELLKGFHTQFAENQRTREQSFLKILGFLGAVILGYAYVYKNLADDVQVFSFAAIIAVIVLFFGSAIVTVIAYSFRRDQYVNVRIRKEADIIGDSKPFPSDYDPTHIFGKSSAIFTWMPDIFLFFFWLFPIFQILVLISYSMKLHLSFSLCQPSGPETSTVIVSVVSIVLSVFAFFRFGSKLKGKIDKWEKEYKKSNERAGV